MARRQGLVIVYLGFWVRSARTGAAGVVVDPQAASEELAAWDEQVGATTKEEIATLGIVDPASARQVGSMGCRAS